MIQLFDIKLRTVRCVRFLSTFRKELTKYSDPEFLTQKRSWYLAVTNTPEYRTTPPPQPPARGVQLYHKIPVISPLGYKPSQL